MKAMSKKKKYRARRKRASSLLSLQFYCSCMSTIFHQKFDTRSLVVLDIYCVLACACSRATVTPKRQPGIVAMLQEQQGLLHQIFNEQQKLRAIVEENRKRIEEVEQGLKSVTDEWSNSTASAVSSSPAWERKRTVTRDLTVI